MGVRHNQSLGSPSSHFESWRLTILGMRRMLKVFGSLAILGLALSGCGASGSTNQSQASSDDAFELERKVKYTEGYCDYVNDLTTASSFFWHFFRDGTGGAVVRKGDFYAGSWVYRIGEMLKFNEMEDTPAGKWIMGYAKYFEALDTKFKEQDIQPTKEELGKLGALLSALQSQTTGYPKWDACKDSYEPTTEEIQGLLDSINSYRDFLENPSGTK